jgi:branched-chain amino acid transport system substrate-binding protein
VSYELHHERAAYFKRANLIRQVTSIKDLELPMLAPGIRIITTPTDYFSIEQDQMVRFDGTKWVHMREIISGR